jgi:hypothetical protein
MKNKKQKTKLKGLKKTPPKFKPKKKSVGIDSYVLKGESCRKVLNAKDLQPCETKKCQFFKDMCQPCKECGSQSKIVNIRCKTCFDCENTPDSLRFDKKDKCKGDCKDEPVDKYKQAEEELALKGELMAIMMKIQDMQNKNKSKGKKGGKEESQQPQIPSYLG